MKKTNYKKMKFNPFNQIGTIFYVLTAIMFAGCQTKNMT